MTQADRLRANQDKLFQRIGVDVTYQKFENVSGNTDLLEEVIDEEAAYPTSVQLKGITDYFPGTAIRSKLGLSEDVAVTLELSTTELENSGVTVTSKDRFILPDSDKPYYVEKVAPNQQLGNEFLTYLIALTRKRGGKRNR